MRTINELLSWSIREKLDPHDSERIVKLWSFLNTDEGRKVIGFNNELLTEIVFHTTIHCENLFQITSRLDEKTNFMSRIGDKSSLFYLLVSMLLHDAGLSLLPQWDAEIKIEGLKNHSLKELREKHAERFSEWIKNNENLLLEKGFLKKDEFPIIELLAKYHSKSTSYLETGDNCLNKDPLLAQAKGGPVKLLISILRLLDACDVNKNRVTRAHEQLSEECINVFHRLLEKGNENKKVIEENIEFLNEQKWHYKKHQHFCGTFFYKKNEKIVIVFAPSLDKPWKEMLSVFNTSKEKNGFSGPKEDIMNELEVENGVVKRTLKEVGIDFEDEYIRLLDPLKDYNIIQQVYPLG